MGGGGKETPRQKMIGMMYLVLTAMLALNVSKSVLDAFVLIDDGLMRTTLNFVAKNQAAYDIFDAQMENAGARVGPYRDAAHEVKRRADQLTFDLQELKAQIVMAVDGVNAAAVTPMDWMIGYGPTAERKQTNNVESHQIQGKDNKDRPAEIMIVRGEGAILKNKMDEFREYLIGLANGDEAIIHTLEELLNTNASVAPTGETEPWELHNFAQLPMVAVITNLTLMQSSVRNAEAEIVQHLLYQIGATDTRVNKMEAVVLTRSNYVMRGGQFEARVLLAAYDSLQKPEILVGRYRRVDDDYEMVDGGQVLQYDERGRAMIIRPGTAVGNFTVEGLLRMQTADGLRSFPFSTEYQVGESSTVISADAMNVLYIGLDNPISIAMPGVPTEQIQVSINNGTITRSGGGWIARPASAGNARITARATVDGRQFDGNADFRIMMVPSPVAKVGGRTGGVIEKNTLMSQQGVIADMENFLFNLRYSVTQFNVELSTPQGDMSEAGTGPGFNQRQRDLMNRANRGQRVFITNIRASRVGGGDARQLNDIVFTIQ